MAIVLLAAVHNGELPTAPARKVIDELVAAEVVTRVVEITHQPPVSDAVDRGALVAWRAEQRNLEQRWRDYLGTSKPWSALVGTAGRHVFGARLTVQPGFARKAWRARQIESFVTAKHIEAWRRLLAGDEDLVIVLESDATITSDSLPAVSGIVALAGDEPFYANLAGGLDRADIGIDHLVIGRSEHAVELRKPVTNTSCAYVVNWGLAERLVGFVDAYPKAAGLGVDWLFNAFFLDAADSGAGITCVHADPPALGHGSLTGVTTSWHPDR
jgi:hypothetical protein